MVAVSAAASHLKAPPAWHGRKINSTLQFRPPTHAGPQIPERHPAKFWVNWWLEHAGKCGKEAGGESSCNLSTLEACVAAVRWVWCKVYPRRGLPWCRHSVKCAAPHLKPQRLYGKVMLWNNRLLTYLHLGNETNCLAAQWCRNRHIKEGSDHKSPFFSSCTCAPVPAGGCSGYSRVTARIRVVGRL